MIDSKNIIATRRDSTLQEYEEVYKMIENSYLGGLNYYNGGYLDQHPKESDKAFKARRLQATYYNYIAPLVDMLTGFLYSNTPSRDKFPNEEFVENASGILNFQEIMKTICKYSLLIPIGVLVDNFVFDKEKIVSKADEDSNNINPYIVIYKPWQIRDFYYQDGVLQWVLLDNTYIEKSDPTVAEEEIIGYRLWDTMKFVDYKITLVKGGYQVVEIDTVEHDLGEVPFKICNWQDDNNDFVGESYFEDPCWIVKKIYNYMSYQDEMMASGTFKMLSYPSENGELPATLVEGGVGTLSCLPYDGNLPHEPSFIGAELNDMASLLAAITFAYEQLMSYFGMEVEENKNLPQSGTAKELNFEKLKSILNNGAISLEKTERWIFDIVAKWKGDSSEYEVNYKKDFLTKDIDAKIRQYMELKLLAPYERLNKILDKMIVKLSLSGDVEPDEMEEIMSEIEKSKIGVKNDFNTD